MVMEGREFNYRLGDLVDTRESQTYLAMQCLISLLPYTCCLTAYIPDIKTLHLLITFGERLQLQDRTPFKYFIKTNFQMHLFLQTFLFVLVLFAGVPHQ